MATSEDDKIEWDSRRLHKHSLEAIQEAIGKALQELTGKPYTVDVRTLNRHPKNEHGSALFDIVDLHLRLKEDTGPSPF
ncbi:MAG: hypothetical protein SXG53_16825 [Pseudomonadota bacterium]|nr:hypothetical protein [Pseudomonadota bacterium]